MLQIWALQDGQDVHVGGTSNRATVTFAAELAGILDSVPECAQPVPAAAPAAAPAVAAAASKKGSSKEDE